MGLFSWWKGSESSVSKSASSSSGKQETTTTSGGEVPGLSGAEEVRRPSEITVFEFGSAAATGDRVTVAGYCPVSDELEPCRWQILPATGSDAPQFRVVF